MQLNLENTGVFCFNYLGNFSTKKFRTKQISPRGKLPTYIYSLKICKGILYKERE